GDGADDRPLLSRQVGDARSCEGARCEGAGIRTRSESRRPAGIHELRARPLAPEAALAGFGNWDEENSTVRRLVAVVGEAMIRTVPFFSGTVLARQRVPRGQHRQ